MVAEDAQIGHTEQRLGSAGSAIANIPLLMETVGLKRALDLLITGRIIDGKEAERIGLVNTVVPYEKLEEETVQWCREILANSPTAIRCLKAALNADCDGQAGLQELAGCATMLFYMSDEAQEGRDAFVEKRKPDFSKFDRQP